MVALVVVVVVGSGGPGPRVDDYDDDKPFIHENTLGESAELPT